MLGPRGFRVCYDSGTGMTPDQSHHSYQNYLVFLLPSQAQGVGKEDLKRRNGKI